MCGTFPKAVPGPEVDSVLKQGQNNVPNSPSSYFMLSSPKERRGEVWERRISLAIFCIHVYMHDFLFVSIQLMINFNVFILVFPSAALLKYLSTPRLLMFGICCSSGKLLIITQSFILSFFLLRQGFVLQSRQALNSFVSQASLEFAAVFLPQPS